MSKIKAFPIKDPDNIQEFELEHFKRMLTKSKRAIWQVASKEDQAKLDGAVKQDSKQALFIELLNHGIKDKDAGSIVQKYQTKAQLMADVKKAVENGEKVGFTAKVEEALIKVVNDNN